MLFPLITFPYATRVLEADGIGIVNFYQSIISYISLVTCLGIPLYATREIAKVKNDPCELSKVTTEILWLHILLTICGYILVVIFCFSIPRIKENSILFLILSTSIIFTTIGCEWFYRGTEDFKYITIRGIIVRIIYVPLLFCFVRTKNDLIVYGILTVIASVGNNSFNFYRLRKFIALHDFKEAIKHPGVHLKGALKIFALTAAISIYTQMNIVILGFMTTATNVGYYVAATRITTILSGIVTALQTTLLPRASSLVAQNNAEGFKYTIKKVINFIYCIALPMSVGLIIMSPEIIYTFCGPTYEPSVVTLRIVAINLFIIALSGVISGGILLPLGKENIATISCILGAIVNVVFNLIMIPIFFQNGAALASIATECTVTLSMIFLGRKYIPIKIYENGYLHYIIASIVMFVACDAIQSFNYGTLYRLIIIPIIGIFMYSVVLLTLRDKFALEIISQLRRKIFRI